MQIELIYELSNKDHIEIDTSNFFEGTTIWALDVRLRLNSKLFLKELILISYQ